MYALKTYISKSFYKFVYKRRKKVIKFFNNFFNLA